MELRDKLVVRPDKRFRLADRDPAETLGFEKQSAVEQTEKSIARLDELQYLMYAEHRRALLVVLQGMDGAGKDGTIRHVMRGINPQGCRVTSFKAPSAEEREHDFLWRVHRAAPPAGDVAIFNRSHYEDVLVARVRKLVPKDVWSPRYDHINRFEQLLTDSGVVVAKFFLHISKDEQRRRFEERLRDPTKQWKLSPDDFEDRKHWDQYVTAYEEALARCSTAAAPWFVVPADKKWFRNFRIPHSRRDARSAPHAVPQAVLRRVTGGADMNATHPFPWPFKTPTIATMVFQFRVVTGTPNSLSIWPR